VKGHRQALTDTPSFIKHLSQCLEPPQPALRNTP
jgi:hypothetical protein